MLNPSSQSPNRGTDTEEVKDAEYLNDLNVQLQSMTLDELFIDQQRSEAEFFAGYLALTARTLKDYANLLVAFPEFTVEYLKLLDCYHGEGVMK
jgi:hypothetical protein